MCSIECFKKSLFACSVFSGVSLPHDCDIINLLVFFGTHMGASECEGGPCF